MGNPSPREQATSPDAEFGILIVVVTLILFGGRGYSGYWWW
jgi:hypothetical protein